MLDELLYTMCGPSGTPIGDDAQIVAPWACHECGSMRGFRRRGAQARKRELTSLVGTIALASRMVECQSCDRRFSPLAQLLGLAPRQHRIPELTKATAALAVEVGYAEASRLLAEVGGLEVSARTIRRDLIDAAPEHIAPVDGVSEVPMLLLDGTGERAGSAKGGDALHLAIGVFSRTTKAGRRVCRVELLAATLGESWPKLFELLAPIRPRRRRERRPVLSLRPTRPAGRTGGTRHVRTSSGSRRCGTRDRTARSPGTLMRRG